MTTAPDEIRVDESDAVDGGRLRLLQRAGASLVGFASAFLGPPPVEPTVGVATSGTATVDRSRVIAPAPKLAAQRNWRAHALTVLYGTVGFLGVLVVVASAPVWRNAAPTWRLTVPGIAHPPESSLHAAILFVGGLIAMWVVWA